MLVLVWLGAQETNSKNGSTTLTPLTDPLLLKANVSRIQVQMTTSLPDGAMYLTKVGRAVQCAIVSARFALGVATS